MKCILSTQETYINTGGVLEDMGQSSKTWVSHRKERA